MSVLEALVDIQAKLKSPKDQNAGRYRYRNIEAINQAVKPLAAKHGYAVVYSDEYRDGLCISTCSLVGEGGERISATGFSIVNQNPKGSSIEQSCGASSSYARKYAACGLFAIDSSEDDPDARDGLKAAKAEAWASIKRYAELHNGDAEKMAEGIKKRAGFEDTPGFWRAVGKEFEE